MWLVVSAVVSADCGSHDFGYGDGGYRVILMVVLMMVLIVMMIMMMVMMVMMIVLRC